MAVSAVGVVSFVLVRMSFTTHTITTDQRRIPLAATLVNGAYELPIPAVVFVVPGKYMLFALSASGLPSVARVVRIG